MVSKGCVKNYSVLKVNTHKTACTARDKEGVLIGFLIVDKTTQENTFLIEVCRGYQNKKVGQNLLLKAQHENNQLYARIDSDKPEDEKKMLQLLKKFGFTKVSNSSVLDWHWLKKATD